MAAAGNASLFPFFTELKGAHRVALTTLETAALGSVFVLALAANAGAIRLLARRKSQRRRLSGCLVLNLFCADLLFVSAIPPIVAVRWAESWALGEALCHLLFYLMCLSGSVALLSLAAVSLERLLSILRLRPARPCPPRLAAALLALIWAFAALAALPFALFFTVRPQRQQGREVYICTLIWSTTAGEIAWDVSFVIVVFFIPGLVIVISYSKILQVVLESHGWIKIPIGQVALASLQNYVWYQENILEELNEEKSIAKASRRRLDAGMAYSVSSHIRISRQDFKLLRTLFVLMISFFIMWSPIIITILLILVQKLKPDMNIVPTFFFWIMVFTFSNSVVNPVLYNVSHFKHEWRRIFFCCPGTPGRKTVTDTTLRHHNNGHCTVSVISR